MSFFNSCITYWNKLSLIQRILIGMAFGLLLAAVFPNQGWIEIFGNLFVRALKVAAPVLVLFLVISSLANRRESGSSCRKVIVLYFASMMLSGALAVFTSFVFKPVLILKGISANGAPPESLSEVVNNLLMNFISNPVHALQEGNFIGILAAAVVFGIALSSASETTKTVFSDISDALCRIIAWIVSFAPLGIMGLVYAAVNAGGLESLILYGKLIFVLVSTMAAAALVINPALVYAATRKNPYPLVLQCLKESGIPAFFTRSSAANIPVNMALCEKLKLDSSIYSVSIPLGATINMSGAAITITVLSLAAVNTLGIDVSAGSAVLMCIVAALSACGTSGVAGGSLLLVPLACGMFGISNDIAMQVVGVGFVISVIQDSCETALNSSSDVIFTAAADMGSRK